MIKHSPLISVIMPCYNAEEFVSEAINSVINQSYKNIELIIIDDGSSDNSYDICKKFLVQKDIKISLMMQENKGPYPARNHGLGHAKGKYISFLDADDYWHPECLMLLKQALDDNSGDVAYCGWQNVGNGGPGSNEPYIPPEYEKGDIVKYFLKSCPWPIHAALIKENIIRELGGFSERYFTSLDFDLWLRMISVTKSFVRVPEVLAFYRWHSEGQISSIKSRQVIDAWKVRHNYTIEHPELISHITDSEVKELVNDSILSNAYTAYWRRDIDSALILFRKAFLNGYWEVKDLKYMMLAMLPSRWLKCLLRFFDKAQPGQARTKNGIDT